MRRLEAGELRWLVRAGVAAIAALLLFQQLPTLTDRVADASFGNAIPAADPEPPATAWAPVWSTAEVGAFIGRGEGLDCSIPPAALVAFEARLPQSRRAITPINLTFRQACVAHDYCYRHGRATYGYTQAQCDAALAAASFRICKFVVTRGERGIDMDLESCATQARKVLAGVTLGGTGSFRPSTEDMGQLGQTNVTLDRASTVAEYDPYPQGSAQFVLPRIGHGPCGGRANVPILLTIRRRAGGYGLGQRCFDGSIFIAPGARRGAAATTPVPEDNARTRRARGPAPTAARDVPLGSEYAFDLGMPWLTSEGGLVRRCRNHLHGTTFGRFVEARAMLDYVGCRRGAEVATDPSVVTMYPVPGDLSAAIRAVGIEKTVLRHVDADQLLTDGSRQNAIGCMTGARGGTCRIPLPASCDGEGVDDLHRWLASPPLVGEVRRDARGGTIVGVTLLTRGCGNDVDYQRLTTRTALLDSRGWLLRPNGETFGPPVRWSVPETAEPVLAVGAAGGQRLVSLHVIPKPGLHAKRKLSGFALIAAGILAGIAVGLALFLRRWALWGALAVGGLAALAFAAHRSVAGAIEDGFGPDAELVVYAPGGSVVSTQRLVGGRPWLQRRMPVVADDGRDLVLMPRVLDRADCNRSGLCLDMWVAPFGPAGSQRAYNALREGLPAWASRNTASTLMFVPFREPAASGELGVLDLLVLSAEGGQAVFRSAERPDGRMGFKLVGNAAPGASQDVTT